MSTAYPPRFIRYMFSSMKERDAAQKANMTPGFYGDCPSALTLYYFEPGKDFLSQRFHLAAVQPDEEGTARKNLYAITFHKGPGILHLIIYATPTHGSTPLAMAKPDRQFGSAVTMTLPPDSSNKNTPRIEHLKHRWGGLGSNAYSFDFNGETYEWRDVTGSRPKVRRLIRLAPESKASTEIGQAGANERSQTHDATEDREPLRASIPGKDTDMVTATWTEGAVPDRFGKIGVFRASASEELGSYWTLLAVTSALAVCQQGTAIDGTMSWHQEKMLETGYQPGATPTDRAATWKPHEIKFRAKDDPMMGKTKRANPMKYSSSGST